MKQDVNYVLHHRNVNLKMVELKLNSSHISLYNALFLIWNNCGFDTDLSINRNDVMKLSKIGSANTYTNCLKELDKNNLIKYNPSYNPLIGSKVHLYRFDKGSDNSSDNGSVKSSSKGSDNSSDTLSKLLNKQTIKLINNNVELVNSKLSDWIDKEKSKSSKKTKVFSVEVQDCYENILQYFDETEYPDTEKIAESWKDTIEKLNRIDKLSFDDIRHLVSLIKRDSFWISNFQSINKLRKKNKEGIVYWKYFYNKFKNNNNAALSKNEQRMRDLANW